MNPMEPVSSRFQSGRQPAGQEVWLLEESLYADEGLELWQGQYESAPATLLFLNVPAAKRQVPATGEEGLAALCELRSHPNLARLKGVHLAADQACFRYDSVPKGDLRALLTPPRPAGSVARLILQVAEAVGHLHRQAPPIVHRALRLSLIRVHEAASEPSCLVLGLGLCPLLPAPAGDAIRYASPEQLNGHPPDPRDDVFALGVLWYQLLTGDANTGRPGGSQWRRRLTEHGVPPGQLELLEACFEDSAADRPADATVLATRLREWAQSDAADASSGKPRSRSRRADVQQLFTTLQEKKPDLAKVLTTDLGMKLVLVPAGTFLMGSPESETGRRQNEGPQHEVAITRPFYLSAHAVTQGQYAKVMGRNPSKHDAETGGTPDHPVEYVTWEEAVEFCRRLSEGERVYRLPTEAEWEYACRAGTATAFGFGNALGPTQANFDANFPYGGAPPGRFLEQTTVVAMYPADHFGLHDMHGNVWEWCADWFDSEYYRHSPRRDPLGPPSGKYRVIRGGSWANHAATCRSAHRNGLAPIRRDGCTGFRVVLNTM
jgi:formylglycine-generating enzyme required for sulfatase activity